ncbi:hypothetical protein D2Q93_09400 [Alicyclobacillaceae bacterium I2511]|nr:hypothetical protein D2Q93_09400 [Alicyclobacillaceae bacterium I2511]
MVRDKISILFNSSHLKHIKANDKASLDKLVNLAKENLKWYQSDDYDDSPDLEVEEIISVIREIHEFYRTAHERIIGV